MDLAEDGRRLGQVRRSPGEILAAQEGVEEIMFRVFLAVALIFGAYIPSSEAASAWKCRKSRCFWVEGYTGPVPDFAANWGPPQQPGCYYARNIFSKRWKQVCPSFSVE